jgi:hypothetical protein
MSIVCTSRIGRVEVYARGARVVRLVETPPTLAAGEVDLVVPGITLLAEPGSFGARADGRRVVLVHSAVDTPQGALVEGETVQQLNLVNNRIWRLTTELELLSQQRPLLIEADLQPRRSRRRDVVARRLADAIAAADLLGRQLEALDERTAILKVQLRMAEREKAELALRDAQASEAARRGVERATSRVTIRVGGDGPVGALELSYFVTAARWWPRYTLRLTDGGRAGTLALEALVAQLTAEDWAGVKLSLSTADYLFDTQLPELPSLRLGRAQQPRARSFRAAPEGLDRLFEGYDRAFPSPARRVGAASAGGPPPAPPPPPEDAEELEGMLAEAEADMDMKDDDGASMRRRSAPAAKKAAFGATVAQRPSPAPMRSMAPPASAPMEMAASMPSAAPRPKGALGGGGAELRREPAPEPEPAWDDGAWQDFGRLALEAPTDGGRGRLAPTRGPAGKQRARLAAAIEKLAAPRARDPRQSRGSFDHRHEAAGSCDLPSDGLVHRLTLGQAGVQPSLVFRTVPREDPSVFREAELRNPFDAPLLDGPVDIYVEGSLVTTSDLQRVDRGGQLRVGLGVEERIRVVRNGFAEEESAGLLGGSRSVSHKVVIELTSSLNAEVPLEIVDRLPVSDDKTLEVKLVSSAPKVETYDQSDRGRPVRGGLRWKLLLAPSGKAKAELTYRLTFSAKDEVVGGNRRE